MQYGPDIDHSKTDLSIYVMVRNRLPWIKDTPENEKVISNFTLELMYQLNPCFKVEDDKIGNEKNYTIIMQSIIANIICIFMLMAVMSEALSVGNSSATTTPDPGTGEQNQGTYLKSAKAGSVEVEYAEYSSSGSSESEKMTSYVNLKLNAQDQIDMFKGDAVSKAGTIGCYLSIFDDGSLSVGCSCSSSPFKVVPY